MRPNSFKKGQKVKRIEADGSLMDYVYVVVATDGFRCWCRPADGKGWMSANRAFGANEIESVR